VATLPLPATRLERARQGLCLLPLLPAAAAAGAALAPLPIRPAVLAAYAVASIGSCAVEAASRPDVAADKSSRWLFSLVLCLALASEVAL